jgi:LPPG:FO 2-phospho-L-lactate transferase
MRQYGDDDWFGIGDRDLATHLSRTRGLERGETLTLATARLCRALAVATRVLPMSDERCRTMIDTQERGTLTFQEWFVRYRTEPAAVRVWFDGDASATPEVLDAVRGADLVVIGPSNPYVSIDPILGLPGLRDAVFSRPVVAVSPIVNGQAVKGPLASMIPKLAGVPPSAAAIAAHYPGLRGIVVQYGDAVPGMPAWEEETVMRSADDSERLAKALLAHAESVS